MQWRCAAYGAIEPLQCKKQIVTEKNQLDPTEVLEIIYADDSIEVCDCHL